MGKVHSVPWAAMIGTVALCATLSSVVGLGVVGWVTGALAGGGLAGVLATTLGRHVPGPADVVTTVRAVLACGVLALAADALLATAHTTMLVALGATALALDAVDGHVARRTGSATPWGARYDMEVDAFLIAVLSVHVAAQTQWWWVLGIGAMRYAFVAAGHAWSWLRRPSPPRWSAKAIAAVQGIVLLVAATGLLPADWSALLLGAALALLVTSFGRQSWWLWRHRTDPADPAPAQAPATPTAVVTAVAIVGLWFALVPPRLSDGPAVTDLARIPAEGLVLVAVSLALPPRARAVVAVVFGMLSAVAVVLWALGVGFRTILDRPFHVLDDWAYLPKGLDVLAATEGTGTTVLVQVGAAVVVATLVVFLPWAAHRVVRAAAVDRRRSLQVVGALGTVWVLCAAYGGPAGQVASAQATHLAVDSVQQVRADYRDHAVFAEQIETDRFDSVPGDELLAGLQGKDVLLVWVESYGRVALEDPGFSPGILDVLRDGEERLRDAGYRPQSAFLTSPTFGAASWLAHATLQSGLWVDSERRYRQLLGSDRLSLTSAFERAGWRTVFSVPANTRDWPEGAAYYGFDRLFDSRNSGYAGPEFGYASMPDQYTLEHVRRSELTPGDRPPVFAEIDLISSHHPWAPLPDLVDWEDVGDGSVFEGMPERGASAVDGRQDPAAAQRLYGESIEYTWRTLISFLEAYPDPDRVVIVAGDHQPHSFVSGDDPGHDVPVTVLSRDRGVMQRVAGWGWQPRLHPDPGASLWGMDEFRDRLFQTFAEPR